MIDKAKQPWVDISVPIRDAMVHWPSDPPVSIKRVKDIERGDTVPVSWPVVIRSR